MSKVILKAENISKQYRLGLVGTGTLRDDFKRGLARLRGKEDPFLKVGEVNDRSKKGNDDYVWALRDINFEVKQGEVLGIIGKNGAGKSTLLKILSQVTSPTTGRIKSRGRIASLLEVGTGFHPELTGRENIYLNGAILGMNKAEINSKLDEIIDFSGCERYIDTPVKRYSSGMTVRLGFAVAAHLEPEILVVDEVLAVGDAEFQKKAIGKMQDISKGEGRTVLFVSHNMASVQSLCTRGILLENGRINGVDEVHSIITKYLAEGTYVSNFKNKIIDQLKLAQIISFDIISDLKTGHRSRFLFEFYSVNNKTLDLSISFKSVEGNKVFQIFTGHTGDSIKAKAGINKVLITLNELPLISNNYRLSLWLGYGQTCFDFHENIINVKVENSGFNGLAVTENRGYPVIANANWKIYD